MVWSRYFSIAEDGLNRQGADISQLADNRIGKGEAKEVTVSVVRQVLKWQDGQRPRMPGSDFVRTATKHPISQHREKGDEDDQQQKDGTRPEEALRAFMAMQLFDRSRGRLVGEREGSEVLNREQTRLNLILISRARAAALSATTLSGNSSSGLGWALASSTSWRSSTDAVNRYPALVTVSMYCRPLSFSPKARRRAEMLTVRFDSSNKAACPHPRRRSALFVTNRPWLVTRKTSSSKPLGESETAMSSRSRRRSAGFNRNGPNS